ncbi:T6SS immunity protein Tli4 family protein [Luteimonas sp. A277]
MRELKKSNMPLRLCLAALMAVIPAFPSASNMVNESFKTVCVGKVQLSLPESGKLLWSQSFDHSQVEKVRGARTRERFWELVEARERELRALPHNTEAGRLARVERIGDSAAILLYREHEASTRAFRMQRYLWLENHGYTFTSAGALRPQFTHDLQPFTEIFARIQPQLEPVPISSAGFCIDGAIVHGYGDKITAGVSVDIPAWNHVRLWAGAVEDPSGNNEAPSADRELKRKQEAMATVRQQEPQALADPEYPREFQVLRNAERAIGGLAGSEVVWRERLNNGAVLYSFRWHARVPSSKHDVTVGMDVGDKYQPDEMPPGETELITLWDAMLESVRSAGT